MAITSITLTNFRNHNDFSNTAGRKYILIAGSNGIGKTNILEAISLLSPGRGFRNIKFSEIPNKATNSNTWSVYTELHESFGGHRLGTGIIDSKKKIFRVNGENLQRQQDILQFIRVVWLTPQMDGLFLDSPSARRKYIDRVTFNFFPEHANNTLHYQYAMRSRNKLLVDNVSDDIWLTNLESSMVEYGKKIASLRLKSIEMLNDAMSSIKSGFLRPELKMDETFDADIDEAQYKAELKQSRMKDLKRRGCSLGPHKSDVVAKHPVKQIEALYCSTGEQKAMLISLTLGQVIVLNKNCNIKPIVLLDEVFAHLDEDRKKQLLLELENLDAQFWITTTEIDNAPSIDEDLNMILL